MPFEPDISDSPDRDQGKAMSENVEVVRRFYEARERSRASYWQNRRSFVAGFDAGELAPEDQAVLACLHPQIEYIALASMIEGGPVRGHRAWLKFWEEILAETEEFSATLDDVAELEGNRVLTSGELSVRWKGSRMRLTEPRFSIITLRDGLILQMTAFRERKDALKSAGLSE